MRASARPRGGRVGRRAALGTPYVGACEVCEKRRWAVWVGAFYKAEGCGDGSVAAPSTRQILQEPEGVVCGAQSGRGARRVSRAVWEGD